MTTPREHAITTTATALATHDPAAAALNYHNPNRYPCRALWLIPLT